MEQKKKSNILYSFLNYSFLGIKGIIMGLANAIPGVSGGTLAIILEIYDRLIEAISTIFKKFKENILFLIVVLLGMGIGILLGAKSVKIGLEHFPLATILLFTGMIIGGIPLLYKKVKGSIKNAPNILIFALIFVFFTFFFLVVKGKEVTIDNIEWYDYFIFFGLGIIGAATMLVPGVSGSLTLMAMGYYELIMGECVGNILDFSKLGFHLQVLIPFGLGCVVGILLIAKIINFLLKRFEVKTYFGIFGIIFSSLIIIFVKNLEGYNFDLVPFIIELGVGLVLLLIGFSLSYSIANKGIYFLVFRLNKKKEIANER